MFIIALYSLMIAFLLPNYNELQGRENEKTKFTSFFWTRLLTRTSVWGATRWKLIPRTSRTCFNPAGPQILARNTQKCYNKIAKHLKLSNEY